MPFILDLIILIPLLWGGYQGYTKGLLSEVVSILHFGIAFIISFKLVGLLFRKVLEQYVFQFNPNFIAELAFACSVIGALALLTTAGRYLKTEIDYDFPGAWDNIIGAGFGVVKYAIVLSFFFWFIDAFGSLRTNLTGDSYTYSIVQNIAFKIVGVTDDDALSRAIGEALGYLPFLLLIKPREK